MTYAAFLRGINVGGNKKVAMAELRQMFADIGFGEVKTLLQSGNVVFESSEEAEVLEAKLCEETEKQLNVKCDYFVRSSQQLEEAVAANPFTREAKDDPSHLIVVFLRESPDAGTVQSVAAAIQGPDKMKAFGRQIYVVYPDGIGPSTVGRTPGWNKLVGVGTARNWNTLLKVAELVRTG